MIRYFAFACILKLFSLSTQTKKFYRILGNTFGGYRRAKAGLPAAYIEQARWILHALEALDVAHQDARYLELGTGWVHWLSTVSRLLYDARFTLYDVWDNRQFRAYKVYCSELCDVFDREIEIPPMRYDQARNLLDKVASVYSFAELYDQLGFEYVVDPTGKLQGLDHKPYDACFSYDVFEHIDCTIIFEYIEKLYGLLKPGGYSIQCIDISDHLAFYSLGVCNKDYLRYSDDAWRFFFDNKIRYFNRIQRDEWLGMFHQAGFELVEERTHLQPAPSRISKKYMNLSSKDAQCISLEIVHQKPM